MFSLILQVPFTSNLRELCLQISEKSPAEEWIKRFSLSAIPKICGLKCLVWNLNFKLHNQVQALANCVSSLETFSGGFWKCSLDSRQRGSDWNVILGKLYLEHFRIHKTVGFLDPVHSLWTDGPWSYSSSFEQFFLSNGSTESSWYIKSQRSKQITITNST